MSLTFDELRAASKDEGNWYRYEPDTYKPYRWEP